ncbi:vitamin B12-dependent ribonucleotide reductase [Bombella sp. TMW 2.2543]|uniref:ribonucleoside-diphosphate reductase n=1 Tax=Bombella pluederhausensis TaxID=2967336 RepID=A0ABT3WGT0_9PROT|nr:vitamin B12-dependent ribonucleotide reductase [Bombella pluederhausensis]MCX5618312.1 vitamin B12-dependent ribonucleotide reductase [Bombella pluederhausensis]
MRTLQTSTDPDSAALRTVTLPSVWSDDAAQALAQLAPAEGGSVRLASEAARWVELIDSTPPLPHAQQDAPPVGRSLSCLLLMQQMAPNRALWRNDPDGQPGFVVRLSGFVQDGLFATEHFAACLKLACDSLRRLDAAQRPYRSGELPLFDEPAPIGSQDGPIGIILLTDLDACLAALGLDYDSNEGRNFAKGISQFTRLIARAGTASPDTVFSCPQAPDIEQAAIAIQTATQSLSGLAMIETGFSSPGEVDALLDVEACGLGPVFSLVNGRGGLRQSTLNRLAHKGLSPEAALALALDGQAPLQPARADAHAQMHETVLPFCDHLPALPEPEMDDMREKLGRGVRRPLPMRQGGFSQRAAIGGHRLFMRTGEFEDGTLGSLSLTPPRESPMARGLMECFGQAVSIGLQFGVPLDVFVEQFAYSRFGACGTVEGDDVASYATSMLDYAFRALSDAYLGQRMPDAPVDSGEKQHEAPMLPFGPGQGDGPASRPRNRKLRLVG